VRNLLRLFALLLLVFGAAVNAAPAVRLVVNCVPNPIPPPNPDCFYKPAGEQFDFWVIAVDANNQVATNYGSTVSISIPGFAFVILPPPHTFTAADNSAFEFPITLNFPGGPVGSSGGTWTIGINATDTDGLTGVQSFFFTVGQPQPQDIHLAPLFSVGASLALIIMLGMLAICFLHTRTYNNS